MNAAFLALMPVMLGYFTGDIGIELGFFGSVASLGDF
jgi:hypothetical protein